MKYVAALALLVIIGFLIRRPPAPVPAAPSPAPIAVSASAPAPTAAPTPTALRRPIARTQEMLGQVQQRNGAGEF